MRLKRTPRRRRRDPKARRVAAAAYRWGRFVFRATRRARARPGQYAIAASEPRSRRDRRRVFLHRYAAAAARPVATPAFFARRPRFARPGECPRRRRDRRRVDAYVVVERERRRGGSTSPGGGARHWDICDGTSASRASPSDHKNTSDKNSKAVLRISVITLIRTDTTLDLSQKAEKGKSPLCRPADESRFSGPQAMTLSRQFYDPGEGAAIGGSWRGPGPFQGRRAPFSGPAYRRGAAPAAFLLVRGSLAAPGVRRRQGLPQRALVCPAPRAWLPRRA